MVRQLLQCKYIELDSRDKDGKNVFLIAAERGHTEVVKLLGEAEGLDYNVQTKGGWNALMVAVFSGRIELVRAVMSAVGVDLNAADDDGNTALLLAAMSGREEVVATLLNGYDHSVEQAGGQAQTQLHTGTRDHSQAVDVNIKNINGWNALMAAASQNHMGVLRLLLQQGNLLLNEQVNYRTTIYQTQCMHLFFAVM